MFKEAPTLKEHVTKLRLRIDPFSVGPNSKDIFELLYTGAAVAFGGAIFATFICWLQEKGVFKLRK